MVLKFKIGATFTNIVRGWSNVGAKISKKSKVASGL